MDFFYSWRHLCQAQHLLSNILLLSKRTNRGHLGFTKTRQTLFLHLLWILVSNFVNLKLCQSNYNSINLLFSFNVWHRWFDIHFRKETNMTFWSNLTLLQLFHQAWKLFTIDYLSQSRISQSNNKTNILTFTIWKLSIVLGFEERICTLFSFTVWLVLCQSFWGYYILKSFLQEKIWFLPNNYLSVLFLSNTNNLYIIILF